MDIGRLVTRYARRFSRVHAGVHSLSSRWARGCSSRWPRRWRAVRSETTSRTCSAPTPGMRAVGNGGLHVTSVIASTDASFEAVLAAAHDIARREATGSAVRRRALTDMTLGDGEFWTITQEQRPGGEQVRVVLPAWQATSNHDLTADPGLGFAAVGRAALAAAATMSPGIPDISARQSPTARYGRWGFEAVAVTAVALRSAMVSSALSRSATLRFGHPYAVVAVTSARRRGDPWAGVPVFAAWVCGPADVTSIG